MGWRSSLTALVSAFAAGLESWLLPEGSQVEPALDDLGAVSLRWKRIFVFNLHRELSCLLSCLAISDDRGALFRAIYFRR